MSYFLYKLIPPRPTFDTDMSETEQATMGEHVAYWQGLVDRGTAIVFGPVGDPAGVWGLAVVEAVSTQQVHALGNADPAVTSRVARFEACPMPGAIVGLAQAAA
ncbi:MAG: YciI family protein [Actinomycetota bacterium]|nr:YciI family protein [Actinomycetota bacterium]